MENCEAGVSFAASGGGLSPQPTDIFPQLMDNDPADVADDHLKHLGEAHQLWQQMPTNHIVLGTEWL